MSTHFGRTCAKRAMFININCKLMFINIAIFHKVDLSSIFGRLCHGTNFWRGTNIFYDATLIVCTKSWLLTSSEYDASEKRDRCFIHHLLHVQVYLHRVLCSRCLQDTNCKKNGHTSIGIYN
jgi:hypothetical protein